MPKTKKVRFPSKIPMLIAAGVLIIIGLFIIKSYSIKKLPYTGPSPAPSFVSKPVKDQSAVPENNISVKGELLCLPHKNQAGPQTMECAYGLKADNGTYYGLTDSDPNYKNLTNVAMNKKVEITGSIRLGDDQKYNTVGIITIQKLKQL